VTVGPLGRCPLAATSFVASDSTAQSFTVGGLSEFSERCKWFVFNRQHISRCRCCSALRPRVGIDLPPCEHAFENLHAVAFGLASLSQSFSRHGNAAGR